MRKFFFLVYTLLISTFVFSQQSNEKSMQYYEDSLNVLANYMINETFFKNRLKANREFIPLLVTSLKNKNSFHFKFNNLENLSVLYPPDSTFRILSWAVRKDDKAGNAYYGAIQMNNSEKLELYALRDQTEAIENLERTELDEKNWYGCVYYNLVQRSFENKKYYTIFGWDGNQAYTTKKYIDVITIEDGKPKFGAPIFEIKKDGNLGILHRIKFEYNAMATVTINYDEDLQQIVFDHISPEDGESYGLYPTYIPDGTYEALKFENGKWKYIEKVFHLTYDKPPMPAPLFKDKGPAPFLMPK